LSFFIYISPRIALDAKPALPDISIFSNMALAIFTMKKYIYRCLLYSFAFYFAALLSLWFKKVF